MTNFESTSMHAQTNAAAKELLNKVPEVTLYFWIIKMLSTTVGETAADFLIFDLSFGLMATSIVMAALLVGVLIRQVQTDKYIPWIYWLSVVMISIVGTLITDNLVDNLGVALTTITVVFSVALVAIFAIWYRSEKTLSIHSIFTRKREMYYWAAILITFALGTAAGDLAAEGWGLGYGISALIFAAMIAMVALAHYVFKAPAVLSFWLAYILTRPLGASFGDLLSQTTDNGGLGLGTIGTSTIFLIIIFALVTYLSITRKDVQVAQIVKT